MYKGDIGEAEPQGQMAARCGGGTKGHRRSLEFPDIPEAKYIRVLWEAPSAPLL